MSMHMRVAFVEKYANDIYIYIRFMHIHANVYECIYVRLIALL